MALSLERQLFFDAYIEAALWLCIDSNGDPLDKKYDNEDISPEAMRDMLRDCTDFYNRTRADLQLQGTMDKNGHDFWLTRNGAGAGFWDRGTGAVGERLTRAAKVYGTCDLYPGDDGKLYLH